MEITAADAEVKSRVMNASLPSADKGAAGGCGPAPPRPHAPRGGLAPSLENRRMQLYLAQLFADVAIIAGSFVASRMVIDGDPLGFPVLLTTFLITPPFLLIALYSGTYSQRTLTDWRIASVRVLWALVVGAALLAFLSFFSQLRIESSRTSFAIGMMLSATGMVAMRIVASHWIRAAWGPSTINRLVIAAGGPEVRMADAYHIDAGEHALVPNVEDPAALDRLAQYLANMDQVLVTCPERDRVAWSEVLKGSGVHGEVISTYAREIGALGIIHHEQSRISTLLVSSGPLSLRARTMKRTFDVVVSGLVLLALLPLFVAVAVAIKLDDGGSIFFRQRRMGQGNRFFSILKFRSMREAESDADGNRSAARDDDRITRIGRFLRKTSIDELPQLINVLRGDMSLVGPRPHALGSQAGSKLFWQVDRRYWQRHCLRPGITGLAQVRGLRGATATEEDLFYRLQADLEYIQGWTIWRDVGVLFSTLKVIIHDRAF